MKFNRTTTLIKAHYFMLFAGMVPVLPFFIVLGVNLGVPIELQGALASVILLTTMVAKPALSVLADAFPEWRKFIFLASLVACGMSFSCIGFVSHFGNKFSLPDSLIVPDLGPKVVSSPRVVGSATDDDETFIGDRDYPRNESLGDETGSRVDIFKPFKTNGSLTWDQIILLLPKTGSCLLDHGHDCHISSENKSELLQLKYSGGKNYISENYNSYDVGTSGNSSPPLGFVTIECLAGGFEGDCDHGNVWNTKGFWAFTLLLLLGMTSFSTANSFTDTVTVEAVGPNGNYGSHRAWGSAGWGLLGPLSGLLVDWWSGDAEIKNYTPAFVLVIIFISVDVVILVNLKVPKLEVNNQVWASVWPLLKQPRFLLFLFFSVLNGCFDGVVLNFLFVLQEDMAAGTLAMQNIKFIQGMTLFVQCATEVPCMFLCNRLVKKIGADRVTTVVLGLHVIRLFLIASVGLWGTVWLTVAVELLNGPCYGFGYSAIVVYAGQLAPHGASTTVQSLANVSYECIGYAVSTFLSGLIVSHIGSVKLFIIWGLVGIVTCVLHLFYVRCVPPIQGAKNLNPPLGQRNPDSCGATGTVEEELYLQGGEPFEANHVTASQPSPPPTPSPSAVNTRRSTDNLSYCSERTADYVEDKTITKSWDKYLAKSITCLNGVLPLGRRGSSYLDDDSCDPSMDLCEASVTIH